MLIAYVIIIIRFTENEEYIAVIKVYYLFQNVHMSISPCVCHVLLNKTTEEIWSVA